MMSGIERESYSIRTFCYPDDYEEVYSLWQSAGAGIHAGRSDTPDEIEKKIQRDPELFLLAELDGKIVGTVLGGFDGRRGIVYHLAVEANQRKKGIGERLMVELEQRLKDKGCIRSYLLVTYDNLEAVRFYEKRGWTRMELYTYGKDIR